MFIKDIKYNSESEQQDSSGHSEDSSSINRFVAQRNYELKLQKLIKQYFDLWKKETITAYRQNMYMAELHYKQKLCEKSFDGIIEYATKTVEFNKKIIMTCYNVLIRRGWEALVHIDKQQIISEPSHKEQFSNKQEKIFEQFKKELETKNPQSKQQLCNKKIPVPQPNQEREVSQTNHEKQLYQEQLGFTISVSNQESERKNSYPNQRIYAHFSQSSLNFSRKSQDSSYLESRKYRAITQKVQLPSFPNQSDPQNISNDQKDIKRQSRDNNRTSVPEDIVINTKPIEEVKGIDQEEQRINQLRDWIKGLMKKQMIVQSLCLEQISKYDKNLDTRSGLSVICRNLQDLER